MKTDVLFRTLAIGLSLAAGTGCNTVTYTPKAKEAPPKIGFLNARNVVLEALVPAKFVWLGDSYLSDLQRANARVTPAGLLVPTEGRETTITLPWRNLRMLSTGTSIEGHYAGDKMGGLNARSAGAMFRCYVQDAAAARVLADAVNSLIVEAKGGNRVQRGAEFEVFKAQAKAWRELATKPSYPAEAERQRVLAEHAVGEKKYEKALEHLEAGLAADPLWPEGHYNAALLYAEIEAYLYAAEHMRRYLELMPNAPDAPAARVKLIVWDDKAK